MERAVGTKEMIPVSGIRPNETLMINVGVARSVGIVKNIHKGQIEMDLKIPVCADKNDKVVLSRQIQGRWRLIGYGEIVE